MFPCGNQSASLAFRRPLASPKPAASACISRGAMEPSSRLRAHYVRSAHTVKLKNVRAARIFGR